MCSPEERTTNHPAPFRILPGCALAILLAYITVAATDRAAHRPFWTDEIFTVGVTSLPSVAEILAALEDATDSNPLLYFLIERFFRSFTADPHIGFRLASCLGYAAMSLALFIFVRRRSGAIGGAVAAALCLATPLYSRYAIEARPYALVLASVAWAMVMWQLLERRWAAIAFGFFLTLATAVHYYAVLALIPFGLAELARSTQKREIRLAVWCALVAALAPVAAAWPILRNLRSTLGDQFWAPARLSFVLNAHEENLGLPYMFGIVVAFALSGALVVAIVRGVSRQEASVDRTTENVLLLALINIPAFAYILAAVGGGGLTPRYALLSVIGVVCTAAIVVVERSGGRGIALLTLLLAGFSLREGFYWRDHLVARASETTSADLAILQKLREPLGDMTLPIVVSHGHTFLEMDYYGAHLTYLADRSAAIKYAGSDSVDVPLELLARVKPLGVVSRSRFMQDHSRFLMFSSPDRWDWLYSLLIEEGWLVRPLAVDRARARVSVLYLVERSPLPPGTDAR